MIKKTQSLLFQSAVMVDTEEAIRVRTSLARTSVTQQFRVRSLKGILGKEVLLIDRELVRRLYDKQYHIDLRFVPQKRYGCDYIV